MNIDICESCGNTSLDKEADIKKLSIRALTDGTSNHTFEGSLEACKVCRDTIIHVKLMEITASVLNFTIKVEGGKQ